MNVLVAGLALISVMSGKGVPNTSLQWKEIKKETMSTILEQMNNRFLKMHYYKVNITDASYADYTTAAYHERSAGYFIRMGDKFHSYTLGVHTLQDKQCRIIVDSVKKSVMISDPMDYFEKSLTSGDYDELLKICQKVLISHNEKQISYRMEFTKGAPYTAYQITLKDSLPEKIVMYYSQAVQGKGEKVKSAPRMEISFNNWQTNTTALWDAVQIKNYVDLDVKENKYVLKAPYAKKYTLFDGRVLTKTKKS